MPESPAAPKPQIYEAGTDMAGKLCSICQTAVITGEHIVFCPFCQLPFHAECWDENRGCSAYGCQGAPPTIKTPTETDVSSNAWGGEKPCPNCGKSIKASALKCRFCGAAFDTRDVIGKKEYQSREYEGREYTAARNKSVLLFLLSAAACLAPIGLILDLVLIFSGSIMGVEFKRMPAALKAVIYCAAGVSTVLIVIMILVAAFDK
ncbi:MAG TPA: RING finger protein [Planctomycetota bacterium]|nr:RING finger protein [Planctomycetota bacterium]